MSEYQYYEFLAIDRPLDADQLRQVRALSTRAEITPTSFVNEYHFGNFRGDPNQLMERYYDAFLYTANWGTHQLMVKLPAGLLDLATARRYCDTDSARAWSCGEHVVVDLHRHIEDDNHWDDEPGDGHLAAIIPARAQLAAGDLRMLYLGWLLSVMDEAPDDGAPEPPVPPNLAALDGPLRSLVGFLRLDEDLLAAAAEASPGLPTSQPSESELASWVAALPAPEKDALLLRAARGGAAHLGTELLRRFHRQHAADPPATGSGRTVAQLREAAQARAAERERLAAEQRERQRLQREREEAAARRRRLDALEQQGEQPWRQVTSLIETKRPREYDQAVALLVDLRELSQRQGRAEAFAERVRQLRRRFAGRPGLLNRLHHAGLES